jgi:hypothetical protein
VCGRVIVLDAGRPVFDGTASALAERGAARVWETNRPQPQASARAVGPDRFRCVGPTPPPDGVLVDPTVADGYLAVIHRVNGAPGAT